MVIRYLYIPFPPPSFHLILINFLFSFHYGNINRCNSVLRRKQWTEYDYSLRRVCCKLIARYLIMRPRNSFVCLQMRVHGILVMYGLFDRNECFKSGLTGDLCDWFLRCNDYFIQISNGMVHHFYSPQLFNTRPMPIRLLM